MGPFELLSDGSDMPVFDVDAEGRTHGQVGSPDVSNRLREHGWQVPAYPMPADIEDMTVLRVVVRERFSMDLSDKLLADLRERRWPPREACRAPCPRTSQPFAHT